MLISTYRAKLQAATMVFKQSTTSAYNIIHMPETTQGHALEKYQADLEVIQGLKFS